MIQTARNDLLQVSVCPCARITIWEVFQQAFSAPIFNQTFTRIGQEKVVKSEETLASVLWLRTEQRLSSFHFLQTPNFSCWPHTNGSNQLPKGSCWHLKMFALCILLYIPLSFLIWKQRGCWKNGQFFLFFFFSERFWFSISWTLLLKGVVQWKCNGYGNLFIMLGMSIRTFVLVGPRGHGKNKPAVCFFNDPSSANGAQAVKQWCMFLDHRWIQVLVHPGPAGSWQCPCQSPTQEAWLALPLQMEHPSITPPRGSS